MEVNLRKREIKSRCPECGNIELNLSCAHDDISNSNVTIGCPVCGLSGTGECDEQAYNDMIRRVPIHSLEGVLSSYLGTISVTLDDLNQSVGQFARALEVLHIGGLVQ